MFNIVQIEVSVVRGWWNSPLIQLYQEMLLCVLSCEIPGIGMEKNAVA